MYYFVTYKDLDSWYCCKCDTLEQAKNFYANNEHDPDFTNMTISKTYTGPMDVVTLFFNYA